MSTFNIEIANTFLPLQVTANPELVTWSDLKEGLESCFVEFTQAQKIKTKWNSMLKVAGVVLGGREKENYYPHLSTGGTEFQTLFTKECQFLASSLEPLPLGCLYLLPADLVSKLNRIAGVNRKTPLALRLKVEGHPFELCWFPHLHDEASGSGSGKKTILGSDFYKAFWKDFQLFLESETQQQQQQPKDIVFALNLHHNIINKKTIGEDDESKTAATSGKIRRKFNETILKLLRQDQSQEQTVHLSDYTIWMYKVKNKRQRPKCSHATVVEKEAEKMKTEKQEEVEEEDTHQSLDSVSLPPCDKKKDFSKAKEKKIEKKKRKILSPSVVHSQTKSEKISVVQLLPIVDSEKNFSQVLQEEEGQEDQIASPPPPIQMISDNIEPTPGSGSTSTSTSLSTSSSSTALTLQDIRMKHGIPKSTTTTTSVGPSKMMVKNQSNSQGHTLLETIEEEVNNDNERVSSQINKYQSPKEEEQITRPPDAATPPQQLIENPNSWTTLMASLNRKFRGAKQALEDIEVPTVWALGRRFKDSYLSTPGVTNQGTVDMEMTNAYAWAVYILSGILASIVFSLFVTFIVFLVKKSQKNKAATTTSTSTPKKRNSDLGKSEKAPLLAVSSTAEPERQGGSTAAAASLAAKSKTSDLIAQTKHEDQRKGILSFRDKQKTSGISEDPQQHQEEEDEEEGGGLLVEGGASEGGLSDDLLDEEEEEEELEKDIIHSGPSTSNKDELFSEQEDGETSDVEHDIALDSLEDEDQVGEEEAEEEAEILESGKQNSQRGLSEDSLKAAFNTKSHLAASHAQAITVK